MPNHAKKHEKNANHVMWKVLICTNAYSGPLDKPLAASVLPVRSVQVATAPLSGNLAPTILHLLGLDHKQLTYNHAGRDFRLTDTKGRVVREIVA